MSLRCLVLNRPRSSVDVQKGQSQSGKKGHALTITQLNHFGSGLLNSLQDV